MSLALAFGIIAMLGLTAFIRLAPVNLPDWHQPLPAASPASLDCPATVQTARGSASAACLFADAPPALLARLNTAALATPRTTLVAGSPAEGLMTWETRSAIWGFPDYTTAQATATPQGTRLDLSARLRFGGYDFGVNAAWLTDWLARL
ncbi:MAG: DUF1499 domain-containing protein [Pseudomonadota bacterium]